METRRREKPTAARGKNERIDKKDALHDMELISPRIFNRLNQDIKRSESLFLPSNSPRCVICGISSGEFLLPGCQLLRSSRTNLIMMRRG